MGARLRERIRKSTQEKSAQKTPHSKHLLTILGDLVNSPNKDNPIAQAGEIFVNFRLDGDPTNLLERRIQHDSKHSKPQSKEPMMDLRKRALFEARAKIMKALAHPTRLFIVDELSQRERCVCELTDMIAADISTVSKHLSVLRNAGIISDEKRGSQVYYKLKMPCVLRFFSCAESVLKSLAEEHRGMLA
jgi:ArsR family transcriptional regulator